MISENLRAAVKAALDRGITRYVVAKGSGVDHTALSQFLVEGRDLRVSTVDSLADYLGLELTPKKAETKPE